MQTIENDIDDEDEAGHFETCRMQLRFVCKKCCRNFSGSWDRGSGDENVTKFISI